MLLSVPKLLNAHSNLQIIIETVFEVCLSFYDGQVRKIVSTAFILQASGARGRTLHIQEECMQNTYEQQLSTTTVVH